MAPKVSSNRHGCCVETNSTDAASADEASTSGDGSADEGAKDDGATDEDETARGAWSCPKKPPELW